MIPTWLRIQHITSSIDTDIKLSLFSNLIINGLSSFCLLLLLKQRLNYWNNAGRLIHGTGFSFEDGNFVWAGYAAYFLLEEDYTSYYILVFERICKDGCVSEIIFFDFFNASLKLRWCVFCFLNLHKSDNIFENSMAKELF